MDNFDWTTFSDMPLTAVIAFFLYRTLRDMRDYGDRIIDLLSDCLENKEPGDGQAP